MKTNTAKYALYAALGLGTVLTVVAVAGWAFKPYADVAEAGMGLAASRRRNRRR